MKRDLFFIVLFYFLILLEKSFFSYFSILGTVPDLILVSVYLYYFLGTERKKDSLFITIAAGILLDIFSSLPFGVWTTALLLAVFLLQKVSSYFEKTNPTFLPLSFFIFVVVSKIFLILLTPFFSLFNVSSVSIPPIYLNPLEFIMEYIYSLLFLFAFLFLAQKYVSKKISF